MSSAKELREARRRKILERGGDRLAYITGQVKTLPPAEPQVVSPPGESGLKSLSIAGELRSSSEGEYSTCCWLFGLRRFLNFVGLCGVSWIGALFGIWDLVIA